MRENDRIRFDVSPEAIAALDRELERACAEFQRGCGDGGRRGAILALFAVMNHVRSIIPAANLPGRIDPLGCLFDALQMLNLGRVHPMLAPVRSSTGGSPREQHEIEYLRVASAAYVTMLRETGMREKAANARVTRKLAPYFSRIGMPLTDSTVDNWRSAVLAEVPKRARAEPEAELERLLMRAEEGPQFVPGKRRPGLYLLLLCEWRRGPKAVERADSFILDWLAARFAHLGRPEQS
jgi:hypothetical protein